VTIVDITPVFAVVRAPIAVSAKLWRSPPCA